MSATGQGTSLIAGVNFSLIKAQTLGPSGVLTYTHSGPTQPNGPGRPAYSVVVTSGDPAAGGFGEDLGTDLSVPMDAAAVISVAQTTDVITVTNLSAEDTIIIYVECKWLENSEELNLVGASDPSIVIS